MKLILTSSLFILFHLNSFGQQSSIGFINYNLIKTELPEYHLLKVKFEVNKKVLYDSLITLEKRYFDEFSNSCVFNEKPSFLVEIENLYAQFKIIELTKKYDLLFKKLNSIDIQFEEELKDIFIIHLDKYCKQKNTMVIFKNDALLYCYSTVDITNEFHSFLKN